MKNRGSGMGETVKTVTLLLRGFVLAYGIYMVVYGHITPGGGFAGGLIIALLFILLRLVESPGGPGARFPFKGAYIISSAAALVFIAAGLSGAVIFGSIFSERPPGTALRLLSGGSIPVLNIAAGVSAAASVFFVFAVFYAFSSGRDDE